jgi:hypothetical protein
MRIDNRYDHDLYIEDWSFSLWLDSVPLGRGSFPYDLTASSMSETTVTGTTLSALVWGGEQEVRSHQIANGKSMDDLELQAAPIGPDLGLIWAWPSLAGPAGPIRAWLGLIWARSRPNWYCCCIRTAITAGDGG